MKHIEISKRIFHFKQPAGTSRGIYTTRQCYFLTLTDDGMPGIKGVGECASLPKLSCDDLPDYETILHQICKLVESTDKIPYALLRPYPSILFGLETAFAQFNAYGSTMLFDTPFGRGEEGIRINGLVWMGSFDEMAERLEAKLRQGFHCVKLKIGAIDFEKEIELIRHIRKSFDKRQVELRVDANGAFTPKNALQHLETTSMGRYGLSLRCLTPADSLR